MNSYKHTLEVKRPLTWEATLAAMAAQFYGPLIDKIDRVIKSDREGYSIAKYEAELYILTPSELNKIITDAIEGLDEDDDLL